VAEVPKPLCTHARRFFYLYLVQLTVAVKSTPPSGPVNPDGGREFVSAI
jgi:hypothetical protein